MNKYLVKVPFTGYCSIEVEANSILEAKEKGFEEVMFSDEDCDEFSFHTKVVEGNVCYAVLTRIEVDLIEGNDDAV